MNKALVLLALLFVFIIGVIILPAQAEQVVSLEKGTLVIKEVREVKRIPAVPEGLSADLAYKLVTGEKKEGVIKDEEGEMRVAHFSYPLKVKKIFSDRVISYSQGEWAKKTSPPRVEEKPDLALTFFWLWLPALGILIASIANSLLGIGTRKLFVFYVSMLAGMLAGGLAGMFAGMFAGMIAGMLAGGFAGMFAGMLAGMIIAGGLAGEQGYEVVRYYFVFLLAVEIVSFVLSRVAGAVKRNMSAIKR